MKRDKTFSMRTSDAFVNTINSVSTALGISKSKTVEFLCISRCMMFTNNEDVIEGYKDAMNLNKGD